MFDIFVEDEINNFFIDESEVSFDKISEIMEELSISIESSIKFFEIDNDFHKIAINKYESNKWKVDYPIEKEKIHKQQYLTKNECIYLIQKLYKGENLESSKKLIDVPIQHFTLDEMLEFKHEDDMMLKGQDPYAKTKKTSPTVSKEKAIETKKQTTKKVKPKSLETLGNHIKPKLETPKPNLNKIAEKIIKNKPTDDNSFFQI